MGNIVIILKLSRPYFIVGIINFKYSTEIILENEIDRFLSNKYIDLIDFNNSLSSLDLIDLFKNKMVFIDSKKT